MAKFHTNRAVHHIMAETSEAHCVHYKLLKAPGLARQKVSEGADPRTAFAKIVPRETVTQEELEEFIAAQNPLLKPSLMHHAIDALMAAITAQVKAGRQVTLKNQMTFGASFEGRVDPTRPQDVCHLPLAPWVRFSSAFIDAINRGVRIAQEGSSDGEAEE